MGGVVVGEVSGEEVWEVSEGKVREISVGN